ncbi:sigma 54-interacting transcriptional regulator [Dysosmobacter sp.]|uniref:sigma 54-interacting transcriptional regulator n=1 Tax=Dysosmobacter sp. TaxID=2591382 RepID=UPI002A8FBFB4|nr:sigma 54-interacting transcriptional regulator [Dysosmobacter sp.]MDY3984741.1 sigma 54-interacting transcriptional regulator [Dysosmobacter sp.]
MTHILFFSPYPECVPTINEVFQARPDKDEIRYEIIIDQFNNCLESVDADAVISRGFTAHTMKKLGMPCAELRISGYDVIAAVDRCLRQFPCRRVALVGAFNMIYGAENIRGVYPDVTFCCYTAIEETNLEGKIRQAIADGYEAVVGGCSTVAIAEQLGIPAVMIESGKEAINDAIDNALSAVAFASQERQRSAQIANFLNYSFQGILATDRKGTITLDNKYCYQVFTDEKASIIGRNISEFFPCIPFQKVIETGYKVLSEVHRFHDHHLMVNCVPVVGKSENTGCVITFQSVSQIQEAEGKIRKRMHKQGFTAKYSFSDILYQDEIMRETIHTAADYSHADSNVLIYGETGTGKELFAQSIHTASYRHGEPFVAVNCAALPEDLLESELFGYVEGAFTGAAKGGKMGLFEIAHRGTIFLDEIGDISPKLQSRLLRVLQEREIVRIGGETVIPIDVRVISATNRNLRKAVQEGRFRQDLFYRLDVLELNLPPLRRRPKDIPYLIDHFIAFEWERTGCILQKMDESGRAAALEYVWPGNIRELRNFCERICILCTHEYANAEDIRRALPVEQEPVISLHAPTPAASTASFNPLLESERQAIQQALAANGGNRSRTAAALGIDKSTLWRKMKRFGLLDAKK